MLLPTRPSRARRSPTCCRSPTRCCSSSRPATGPTCSRSTASRARSRRSTTSPLAPPSGLPDGRAVPTRRWTIAIDDFDGCPRYIGRLFEDVTIAPSPMWLRARLNAAGHAPDLERRRHHELRDARARQPAARVRLPDARRRPDRRAPRGAGRAPAHARRRRPRARARRPGDRRRRARRSRSPGSWAARRPRSATATTTVLLEAANFEPHGIYRSSERQRLRTEGSNRWEKGVDPYLAGPAADLATRLHARARRRRAGRRTPTCTPSCRSAPVIRFRPERADALIGDRDAARASSTRLLGAARLRARRRRTSSSRPGARATSRARST